MKKSIIATSAASLAVAAMPIVSVFAANPPEVVDTVRVVVNESCTFEATQNNAVIDPQVAASGNDPAKITRTFSKNTTLGTVVTLGGSGTAAEQGVTGDPITIAATCNSGSAQGDKTGTWTISAASTGTMAGSGTNVIPNATTGNEALTHGATSAWSMRIVAPTTGVQDSFGSWHVMPTTATPVVVTTPAATTTDTEFTPEYRVYVGTDQAADTYTGTVTYTISSTWN